MGGTAVGAGLITPDADAGGALQTGGGVIALSLVSLSLSAHPGSKPSGGALGGSDGGTGCLVSGAS